jgi:hypothetical protein
MEPEFLDLYKIFFSAIKFSFDISLTLTKMSFKAFYQLGKSSIDGYQLFFKIRNEYISIKKKRQESLETKQSKKKGIFFIVN